MKSKKKSKIDFIKKKQAKIKRRSLTVISFVLLVAVIFLSTSAWYVLERDFDISIFDDNGENVADWKFEVYVDEECTRSLEGNVNIFENSIKSYTYSYVDENDQEQYMKMMEPGAFGEFNLYIKSSDDVSSAYSIYIDKSFMQVQVTKDDISGTDKNDSQKEIEALEKQGILSDILKNHIRFYSDVEKDADGNIIKYKNEITQYKPFEGVIAQGNHQNSPEKLVIYWTWHYDGQFIIEKLKSNETPIEEKNMLESIYGKLSDGENKIIERYDEEDFQLCEFRDRLQGNIDIQVKGIEEQPTKATLTPTQAANE